ncbi:hypothetical protein EJB05_16365 [Eragrostis curvula]|uniref:Uncharacterized protein n=1 Tax=Eragrostis curvula TaxID=38414 RepID=A0A5J9VDX1_9POAL|nr:hypothetical protein EJB05_16347 [Eragrostis curvula]TVU34530.1 hypothetical protein EJB05_16365 [Eragrostis curvula]
MQMENEAAMELMPWGRRRPRPLTEAAAEELEVERSRAAKTKTDPLSVYETTLLKLRRGSVKAFTAPLDDAMSSNSSNENDNNAAVQNDLKASNKVA